MPDVPDTYSCARNFLRQHRKESGQRYRWECHCQGGLSSIVLIKKKLIRLCHCHRFLSEQVLRNEWFIRSTWLYRLKKLKHNLNRSSIYLRNANSSASITTNKLSRAANESSKLNKKIAWSAGKAVDQVTVALNFNLTVWGSGANFLDQS